MSTYDDCKVLTFTASQGASTNGVTFPIRIHKVAMTHADGTAQATVSLFDALTAVGTAVIILKANEVTDGTASEYEDYTECDFNPPLLIETGLSTTIGNSGVVRVYYTRR